ncbi:MAG: chemotaxis protein CheC [Planctomycetes bacterium]|nr:chemotaxis protein CheC [Planctomycetota bacterium]
MLNDQQLAALTKLFAHGSTDASAALSRWLGRPAQIKISRIEEVALATAAEVLGDPELPVCFCAMSLQGALTGELILAMNDASGQALADLLLSRPLGTSRTWGEVEISAALETANIIGCAYLNALAQMLPDGTELLPTPPRFARDFAESLMEFALMNQAAVSDTVFLTQTEFQIAESPVDCHLLLVPDPESVTVLQGLLAK